MAFTEGMECHVFPGIHGEMNLEDAISQSCNVYFYRLAEKIGFQQLVDTAKLLGLDKNPIIEVPNFETHRLFLTQIGKKKNRCSMDIRGYL